MACIFRKKILRWICADLDINYFQAQLPSRWQVLFVTPQLSAVIVAACRYALKLGLLHSFKYELKGKNTFSSTRCLI